MHKKPEASKPRASAAPQAGGHAVMRSRPASKQTKPGKRCRRQAVGSVARPGGEFRSGRGSQQRDQLNAIRETLEQLEGGTPNVIDV